MHIDADQGLDDEPEQMLVLVLDALPDLEPRSCCPYTAVFIVGLIFIVR